MHPPGGPDWLGDLGLWVQVDQLCWVACNHTLDRGRLVFPMEGVDQVAPPQVGQVNWVAWGYGCRLAS